MGTGIWMTCDWCGEKYEHSYQRGFSAKEPGFGGKTYRCCGAKCQAEAEASFRAKKEAKEAKKAAKQAAREEESESGGGSSSSEELPSGCVKIVGMILAFLVVCGILGALFYKDEDASDPAVKMAKWEEHLEKRRAAFAEGLPEEGIEARGLKNYTWEEWQARNQNTKPVEVKKESESLVSLWSEHQRKRGELIGKGIDTDKVQEIGYGALTFDEFSEQYKGKDVEAEMKKLSAQADELIKEQEEQKASAQRRTTPAVTKPARPVATARPVAPARPVAASANTAARNEAMARKRTETEAQAKANRITEVAVRKDARTKAEAGAKPKDKVATGGAVSGHPNGTGHKASKDSKGIAITVQGKGKTKEAAIRFALRRAVWKTVGTWVGSKTRIEENRAKVIAQVETVTDADVRKYEILDTQQQDGGFVVKVKVSVSKKQIAPKFANIFPDVFVIE